MYAGSDPINYADPLGQCRICSGALIYGFIATQLAPHAQRIGQLARGLNSLGLQSKEMALWLQSHLIFYGRMASNLRTAGWMQALNPATGEIVEVAAMSGVRAYFPAALRAVLDGMPNVVRLASYQGLRHAEQKLVQYALDKGYHIISIGAGKPICPVCYGIIKAAEEAQPFKIFFN